jgi:hypothetical protein
MLEPICSICGKKSQQFVCPECAEEFGLFEGDEGGAMVNESRATSAAKAPLSPVRFLWYKRETRPLIKTWVVLAAPCAVAFVLDWWIVGGILALPCLALAGLCWWICRQETVIYRHALLTAGIVVSKQPLAFVALANMNNCGGAPDCALKRVDILRLPSHPEEVGTLFPCVAGFQEGPRSDRWGDFDPQPLCFGTSNRQLLAARAAKLSEDFASLRALFEQGKYPRKAGELLWVGDPVARTTPPPLPAGPPPIPGGLGRGTG